MANTQIRLLVVDDEPDVLELVGFNPVSELSLPTAVGRGCPLEA